jgi:hypothetical protein
VEIEKVIHIQYMNQEEIFLCALVPLWYVVFRAPIVEQCRNKYEQLLQQVQELLILAEYYVDMLIIGNIGERQR